MKPQLVLHICCAPDEAWVVQKLSDSYSLHCFFSNPNIWPHHEYDLRCNEAEAVARFYGVPFTADTFDPRLWEAAITGYEHTKEKGHRCLECFLLRLRRTADFCKRIQWPTFSTVMSISPHKVLSMLTKAGMQAAMEQGVEFKDFDFKKNNGFIESIQLSKKLQLYRQEYCGCRLSKAERDERNAHKRK